MNQRGFKYFRTVFWGSLGLIGLLAVIKGVGLSEALMQSLHWKTDPAEATPLTEREPDAEMNLDAQLVAANTRFGFKLFSELLAQNEDENLFISPTSVAIALSMTYNGAAGTTQTAMAEALELQGMSLETVNQSNQALLNTLTQADPAVQVAIANSLWARENIPFYPAFLERNQQFFNAEVTALDFSSPEAPDTINAWVEQQTAGKIPTIVDDISPDAVLYLINAIYFKGDWTQPFDPAATQEQPFILLDGTQKLLPLMQQRGEFRYLETESFQAVSLPYGEADRWSMEIFLPRPEVSLAEFYADLTPENWERWMAQLSRREGTIQLPKFKLEDSITLNDALVALGMGPAFDASQADFSELSSLATFIHQVKHKTFVEVNEEGTEAAAVTSIEMRLTSISPVRPFQMRVDRPFFAVIRDRQTGTILFMGSIVEPE